MFRKINLVHYSFAAIAASGLLLSSCGGGKEDDTVIKDVEITNDTVSSETRVNFDALRVNIPTPSKLNAKLSAAKIVYNKSFLLPSSKSGSFSSNYQKAVGMGAFGADLGNAASYNNTQDAIEYLGQMGKLAGDLGISSAFDPEFSKNLLSKLGSPDTFQMMLDQAYDKAERNLRSNQRVATTVLMVTGGWVESLYISVEGLNTAANQDAARPLYEDIRAHCFAFKYAYDLLDAYKSNADCAKMIQDIEPFKAALYTAGDNAKLGPGDLSKLRETVSALRNKITG